MKVFVSKVGSVRFEYPPSAHDLAIDVEDTGIRNDVPPGSGFYLDVLKADPSAPGGDLMIRFTADSGDSAGWHKLAAALEDALKRLNAMGVHDRTIDIRLPHDAFGGDRDPGTDVRNPTGGGGPAII